MKALSQNKQTIYYKLLDGVSDVEIGGLKTGEKQKTYSMLTQARVNVSSARGTADVEQFGVTDNYDRTLVTDDMTCPIDEQSILWIGISPYDESTGAEVPHNYKVVRVARSLNSLMYAIRKVTVS